MTPPEVLREAAKLVRAGWCQGTFARDANGHDVPVCDPRAVCWCALGAIGMAASTSEIADRACDLLAKHPACNEPAIFPWNDDRTQTAENVARTLEEAANG